MVALPAAVLALTMTSAGYLPDGTTTPEPAARPAPAVATVATVAAMAPARGTLRNCGARDLALISIVSDGAAGQIGYVITVANTSHRSCRLLGHRATVVYRNAAGRTVTLPTVRSRRESPTGSLLRPGRRAEMALLMVNGYGGYDPSSPECAHPAIYRNLSAAFHRRGLLPLDNLVLDVKCGDITAYDWVAGSDS